MPPGIPPSVEYRYGGGNGDIIVFLGVPVGGSPFGGAPVVNIFVIGLGVSVETPGLPPFPPSPSSLLFNIAQLRLAYTLLAEDHPKTASP